MGVFQKFRNAMARFMYGRNGMDQLNRTLILVYFVVWLAEVMVHRRAALARVLDGILFLLMVVIFARMLSRNLARRQAENQRWVNWVWRMKSRSAGARARHADKEHKYFTCRSCKAVCRVPVGKGKIVITCPRCGAKLQAKT